MLHVIYIKTTQYRVQYASCEQVSNSTNTSLSPSLSLSSPSPSILMATFPGKPGLAGVYWS